MVQKKVQSPSLHASVAVLLVLSVVGLVGVLLLTMERFSGQKSLLLGLAISSALILWSRARLGFDRLDRLILPLLLVAAFLRFPVYNHVDAGQDQGVYVSYAHHIQRTGSPFVYDEIRRTIPEILLNKYDELAQNHTDIRVPGKDEGSHTPGVYIASQKDSKYVFQFYPLHPIWLAIFGSIGGYKAFAYSQLFFSLLSIWLATRIVFVLTKGSIGASLAFSGFLAVSSLHAFFGKFPISETVTLSFALGAALVHLKGERLSFVEYAAFILALGSMYFSHVSSLIYFGFFAMVCCYFVATSTNWKSWLALHAGSILLFFLSLIYGYKFSYPYFRDIYVSEFGRNWGVALLILCSIVAMAPLFAVLIRKYALRWQPLLQPQMTRLLAFVVAFMLFFSLYLSYRQFSKDIPGFAVDALITMIAEWKIEPLRAMAFTILSEQLGFFVFAAFLFDLVRTVITGKSSYVWILALLFISVYLRICKYPVVDYQYYFARYVYGDVWIFIVMAAFVPIANFLDSRNWLLRAGTGLCIAASASYVLYFTYAQQARESNAGSARFFEELSGVVKPGDIVYSDLGHSLSTGLEFILGTTPLKFKADIFKTEGGLLQRISQIERNQFLLVSQKVSYPFAKLTKSFALDSYIMQHSPGIPTKFHHLLNSRYYLYRIDTSALSGELDHLYVEGDSCGGFYPDKIWSNGTASFCVTRGLESSGEKPYLIVETFGYAPSLDKLAPQLAINDQKPLLPMKIDGENIIFDLRGTSNEEIKKIQVSSKTFVPKELGLNDDTRTLGLDIKQIYFKRTVTF